MQRCVDENNHVVDPSFCKNLAPCQSGLKRRRFNPGFIPLYRYYYGGGGGYGIGSAGQRRRLRTDLAGHAYSSRRAAPRAEASAARTAVVVKAAEEEESNEAHFPEPTAWIGARRSRLPA